MALLGDNPERSTELATQVLELIEGDPDQGENAYWRGATHSEALLLLDRDAEARATLSEAIAQLPYAWEDHAATIRQFELIHLKQNKDTKWLDHYRPAASLYFSGIITLDEDDPDNLRQIEEFIDREKPGFGFGALAAGADILIAEALRKAGAELHITLPYSVDRFREISVEPFGKHWVPRFEELIANAVTLYSLQEMPGVDERSLDAAVEIANLVAMGQSIRNANLLRSAAKALTIVGSSEKPGRNFPIWSHAGRDYFVIETARKAKRENDSDMSIMEKVKPLFAILHLENIDEEILKQQSFRHIEFEKIAGGYRHHSTDIKGLASIAKNLGKSFDDLRASFIIDTINKKSPTKSIFDQVTEMAHASRGGPVLTDYKSAMALTLLNAETSVQEIGELKTAYGAIPLWILV
ncbi:hypothetical protein [Parasphingorhabdus sp.]|uniref:hypothetical protein n=1 Tax=Parasphingorhabdus sp. TaxID=2709688 RepID=UPI0032996EE5